MRRLAVIVSSLPTAAFAQPSVDPSALLPAPPPAMPPGPPSPATVLPAPPSMVPTAPDRFAYHRGFTFEANLGVGFVHASVFGPDYDGTATDTDTAFAGAIGLGGWLSPKLALTGRISGVDVKDPSDTAGNITSVTAFVGPSLQYWIDPHFWIGGGAGLATLREVSGCSGPQACGIKGFGLDLRAGYSFGDTANTFNLSVELTPGVYDADVGGETITGVALLAGYQYL